MVCEWSKIFRIEKLHNVWINIHVFYDEFHQEQKQIPTLNNKLMDTSQRNECC